MSDDTLTIELKRPLTLEEKIWPTLSLREPTILEVRQARGELLKAGPNEPPRDLTQELIVLQCAVPRAAVNTMLHSDYVRADDFFVRFAAAPMPPDGSAGSAA